MRLFVGLKIPDSITPLLRALTGGLPGAKWVNPDGYHLTLRFIGELDNHIAEELDANLAAIQSKKFTLSLKSVGHFGNFEKANAVWAGVSRNDALYHLRDKVESAVVRSGVEPEHRRFTPHITVGKLHRTPPDWLESWLVQNAGFKSPEFEVNEFSLFSSHAGDNGRIYLPEVSYPLGG